MTKAVESLRPYRTVPLKPALSTADILFQRKLRTRMPTLFAKDAKVTGDLWICKQFGEAKQKIYMISAPMRMALHVYMMANSSYRKN